jgi:aryl-alcohol dehydrogenase-like predicted oxidoreductase
VFPIGLGSIGVDDEETTWDRRRDVLQPLDACAGELGVSYLGSAQGFQKSEESIGQWLQGKPAGFRDTFVIGSKVCARPTGREVVRTIGRLSLETPKCGVISVAARNRKDARASRWPGRDFTRTGRARQQDPCL